MNRLVQKVCSHQKITERVMGLINFLNPDTHKDLQIECGTKAIVSDQITDLPSTTSDDDNTVERKYIRRHMEEIEK